LRCRSNQKGKKGESGKPTTDESEMGKGFHQGPKKKKDLARQRLAKKKKKNVPRKEMGALTLGGKTKGRRGGRRIRHSKRGRWKNPKDLEK